MRCTSSMETTSLPSKATNARAALFVTMSPRMPSTSRRLHISLICSLTCRMKCILKRLKANSEKINYRLHCQSNGQASTKMTGPVGISHDYNALLSVLQDLTVCFSFVNDSLSAAAVNCDHLLLKTESWKASTSNGPLKALGQRPGYPLLSAAGFWAPAALAEQSHKICLDPVKRLKSLILQQETVSILHGMTVPKCFWCILLPCFILLCITACA